MDRQIPRMFRCLAIQSLLTSGPKGNSRRNRWPPWKVLLFRKQEPVPRSALNICGSALRNNESSTCKNFFAVVPRRNEESAGVPCRPGPTFRGQPGFLEMADRKNRPCPCRTICGFSVSAAAIRLEDWCLYRLPSFHRFGIHREPSIFFFPRRLTGRRCRVPTVTVRCGPENAHESSARRPPHRHFNDADQVSGHARLSYPVPDAGLAAPWLIQYHPTCREAASTIPR